MSPSVLGVVGSFNTTQTALTNTIDSSVGLGIIVTLVLFIGVVILLIGLISSIERYTAFFRAIGKIALSIKYALYGGGISAAAYGVYSVVNVITMAASNGVFNPMIIVYGIAGYAILVVIGWAAEKAAQKLKHRHAEYLITNPQVAEEVTPCQN